MALSPEAKTILEILAKEYEDDPETRSTGIPPRVLGARAGVFLGNPLHQLSELCKAGFVVWVPIGPDYRNVVLTEKGYRHARPIHRRLRNWAREHTFLGVVSVVLTFLGIVITILIWLWG